MSKANSNNKIVNLTEEQISMLKLSEADIQMDRLISHEELDKIDLQWIQEIIRL